MALIKCPECGNEVSDKANACPKCGYPNNKKETTDKDLSEEITKLQKDLHNKNLQIMDLKNKSNNNSNSNFDKKAFGASNNFVLVGGKYKGALDIPIGIYNIEVIKGNGIIECRKPDDVYIFLNEKQKEYRNLEISDKSILKIDSSMKVRLFHSEKGEYQRAKIEYVEKFNDMKNEIQTIKAELTILNNELIEKYYCFSDYDKISSQDCSNELILLKTEEKDLRITESDIDILTMKTNHKITERSIRQILRNFNSECDNITKNISAKNIDIVRNKIEKSYDSLNKLYGFDGVRLSKKILEVKLKKATLLYTYELKYQQEKDIQQAIKEQMMEEAKAEREIQEQKKKIEKDLQQHLGEVNRLMKYLEKTQIDVEKQLYIDKIKELEDKIKLLEVDKETVLEREANAKAGFVYIISNIGSFGEDIYKIGMTRRLEPMDRVRELSSASVPFEFDVHAMIFSSDAPNLESMLHHHFADRAVNKVNPRKEFFKVSIDEIEQIVKDNYNDTVRFTKIPVAFEYRQSMDLD